MDSVQTYLDIVKPYLPQLAAHATGFALASRISLRTWLAVDALPATPADATAPAAWKYRVPLICLFLTALVGAEFWVMYQSSAVVMETFFASLLGFYVFNQTAWTLASTQMGNRAFGWRMERAFNGFPLGKINRSPEGKGKRVLASLAILAVSAICAMWTICPSPSRMGQFVVTTVILASIAGRRAGKTHSIRGTIISLVAMEALVIAVFVISTVVAARIGGVPEDSDKFDFSSERTMGAGHIIALVCPAIYSACNGFLIVVCYRFDHFLNQRRIEARNQVNGTKVVGPSTLTVAQAEDGTLSVAVPSRVAGGCCYRKPYYFTAMLLTLASHVAAPILFSLVAGDMPSDDFFVQVAIGYIGLFLAIPVASVGVVAVALMRGEGRAMWTYRETWVKKEVAGQVRLDDTTELSLGDEKTALLEGQTA